MANLRTWSTTAASNNQATPDGWPEGQAPSTVNDCGREMMAAVRSWYEDAAWVDFGHTPTYVSTTQFSVSGDRTATYAVNRRVRLVGASTGYGTITASSYGAPNTTITVTWDSGNTPTSPTAVSVGILTSNSGYALSANAALLNAANAFTASQTISTTSTSAIGINSTNADGGQLYIQRSASTKVNLGTEKAVLGSGSVDDALLYGTTGLKLQSGGTITIGGVAATDFARLSQSNTFAGALVFSSSLTLGSSSFFLANATNGFRVNNSANTVNLYQASDAGAHTFKNGSGTTTFGVDSSGLLTTPNASASEVGYKGLPVTAKGTANTFAVETGGSYLINTGAITVTIDNTVHPIGSVLTFVKDGSSNATIALSAGTMYLAGTAFGTTGSRTLAAGGMATAIKMGSSFWMISGTGLT